MSTHIISAGVDWLTLSAVEGGLETSLDLLADRVGELSQAGYDTKSVRWPGGYDGWGVGPISWLSKGDAQLLVLSGATAAEFAGRVMAVAPTKRRITRLDLQVTVADATITGDDMAIATRGNPQIRQTGEIVNDRGGHTVYIGSRSSAQFGRFYRKYSTSLQEWPDATWRWEVEFKKPAADRVWSRLSSDNLCDFVRTWYVERGLPVAWPAGEPVPIDGLSVRDQTDLGRKLEWVRRQVRPFALDTHERGELLAFLRAVGLAVSPTIAREAIELLKNALD